MTYSYRMLLDNGDELIVPANFDFDFDSHEVDWLTSKVAQDSPTPFSLTAASMFLMARREVPDLSYDLFVTAISAAFDGAVEVVNA